MEMLTIDSCCIGSPSHTAEERFGVYPTNQAFLRASVVPVLPALSRSERPARAPVPESVTPESRVLTASAVRSSMARSQVDFGTSRVFFFSPTFCVTDSMAIGVQYMPREAKVA